MGLYLSALGAFDICVMPMISIVPLSAPHTQHRDGRLMFLLSILPSAFVFYFQLKYIIFHIFCQYRQQPKTTLIIPKTHRLSQNMRCAPQRCAFWDFSTSKSSNLPYSKNADISKLRNICILFIFYFSVSSKTSRAPTDTLRDNMYSCKEFPQFYPFP